MKIVKKLLSVFMAAVIMVSTICVGTISVGAEAPKYNPNITVTKGLIDEIYYAIRIQGFTDEEIDFLKRNEDKYSHINLELCTSGQPLSYSINYSLNGTATVIDYTGYGYSDIDCGGFEKKNGKWSIDFKFRFRNYPELYEIVEKTTDCFLGYGYWDDLASGDSALIGGCHFLNFGVIDEQLQADENKKRIRRKG